ncbi:MAG: MiaB/RimO family radical SAM methylthiotransferase [Clostridia bacterium]|nr:MiaB/RimO family radical SAM methylthiotransferase [Clostridia bacterium]
MKFVVFTLGCKVNKYESCSMMRKLADNGFEVSDKLEYADAYIINTCSVTAEADKKSRQAVSRVLKYNPDALVYIMGCSSQNDFMQFAGKPNIRLISGVASKCGMLDNIMSGISPLNEPPCLMARLPDEYEDEPIPFPSKTRGLLKVQDGCNNFCSYCIIPHLRGRSRSRALDSVLSEAKIQAEYTKELVVTGINISAYGKDIGITLTDLVNKLSEVNVRKRFGSLECAAIDEGLLAAMKRADFCDHFHLSLQSGSDAVLKAMNRKYDCKTFLQKIDLIRKYFPDAGITTDIICGFPAETEENHKETVEFVKKAAFSGGHVFVYSKREGTPAAKLPQIENSVKEGRAAEISALIAKSEKQFMEQRKSKVYPVYLENIEDGESVGYTSNYIKVYCDCQKEKEIVNLKLGEIYKEGVKAYE